jgi:putative RNA 2'-phosphotransferase
MTHPALIERITRSLAYMLRHQPEEFDLELDEYGYAEVEDVVRALNERLGEAVDEEDLRDAVLGGDRQRYEIEGTKIRALYGHSIEVLPGEPSQPPAELFVGVSSGDADRARRHGLRAGRRRFLHLALTPEDAMESGRRAAHDYVVITVRAGDAWEEGINFYDRRSLFLSDPIPTEFLEVGEVHTDGFGEEVRDRGGRGGRREERGHGSQRHHGDRPARSQPALGAAAHVHEEEQETEMGAEHEVVHDEMESEAPAFGEGGGAPAGDRGEGPGRRRRGRGRGRGREQGGPPPSGAPRHEQRPHAPRAEQRPMHGSGAGPRGPRPEGRGPRFSA